MISLDKVCTDVPWIIFTAFLSLEIFLSWNKKEKIKSQSGKSKDLTFPSSQQEVTGTRFLCHLKHPLKKKIRKKQTKYINHSFCITCKRQQRTVISERQEMNKMSPTISPVYYPKRVPSIAEAKKSWERA